MFQVSHSITTRLTKLVARNWTLGFSNYSKDCTGVAVVGIDCAVSVVAVVLVAAAGDEVPIEILSSKENRQ